MSADTLAAALIDVIDGDALAELAARLLPHLNGSISSARNEAPAFTVATLAKTLCVSPKTIRGAIQRGELAAAKRQGRWLIQPAAVESWTTPDERTGTLYRSRSRAVRPAFGGSLRPVLVDVSGPSRSDSVAR